MDAKPVFISYSHVNSAIVDRLKSDLQTSGVRVWLDHESLTPGAQNWGTAIRSGIQSCSALIYIASPHAQESDYVTSELDIAKHYQIPIYPFWIDGTNWIESAPLGMSRTQYIDARQEYSLALRQLLALLGTQIEATPDSSSEHQPTESTQTARIKSCKLSHVFTEDKAKRVSATPSGICSVIWTDNTILVTTTDSVTALGGPHVVHIWDAWTNQRIRTLAGHTSFISQVAWSPDVAFVAASGSDNTIRIWDAQSGEQQRVLTGPGTIGSSQGTFCAIAWSPDGRRLAAGAHEKDKLIRVWDAGTGDLLLAVPDNKEHGSGWRPGMQAIVWSPDGTRFATTGPYKVVCIWDAKSGQNLLMLNGSDPGSIAAIAWSPDGTRIATACGTTIRIWDTQRGQQQFTLTGHTGGVDCLGWSPDSAYIVSGADFHTDGTGRIWDAQTGHPLYTLTGHTHYFHITAWSPDGTFLVTGAADQTARIWQLKRD